MLVNARETPRLGGNFTVHLRSLSRIRIRDAHGLISIVAAAPLIQPGPRRRIPVAAVEHAALCPTFRPRVCARADANTVHK